MSAIALESESARVKELVAQARQAGEVLLTEGSQPVAKIVRLTPPSDVVPQFGFAKGAIEIHEDFDEPLDDLFEVFKERTCCSIHTLSCGSASATRGCRRPPCRRFQELELDVGSASPAFGN